MEGRKKENEWKIYLKWKEGTKEKGTTYSNFETEGWRVGKKRNEGSITLKSIEGKKKGRNAEWEGRLKEKERK